jgi:hypothetical protein
MALANSEGFYTPRHLRRDRQYLSANQAGLVQNGSVEHRPVIARARADGKRADSLAIANNTLNIYGWISLQLNHGRKKQG